MTAFDWCCKCDTKHDLDEPCEGAMNKTTLREMFNLLREHYELTECYDAANHRAGLCLCQRTKVAIEALKPYIESNPRLCPILALSGTPLTCYCQDSPCMRY